MTARRHWGLKPSQIVVVPINRLPSLMWEGAARAFQVNYSHNFSYVCAGGGYAMLSLAWASSAFTVDVAGERAYIAGSCCDKRVCVGPHARTAHRAPYATRSPQSSTVITQ